jgi:hypothetical protein
MCLAEPIIIFLRSGLLEGEGAAWLRRRMSVGVKGGICTSVGNRRNWMPDDGDTDAGEQPIQSAAMTSDMEDGECVDCSTCAISEHVIPGRGRPARPCRKYLLTVTHDRAGPGADKIYCITR